MKTIKLATAKNKLEKHVIQWLNTYARHNNMTIDSALSHLYCNGEDYQIVDHLCISADITTFYGQFGSEICDLLKSYIAEFNITGPQEIFSKQWRNNDPFASEPDNQYLLSWFAFTETAWNIATRSGIRV